MNGTKLTLRERLLRRSQYWRRLRSAASTAQAEAVVAWDQVRGEICDLPAAEQDAAWAKVCDALDRVGCQFDTYVDTPSADPTRTDARGRARGAERNTSRKERAR